MLGGAAAKETKGWTELMMPWAEEEMGDTSETPSLSECMTANSHPGVIPVTPQKLRSKPKATGTWRTCHQPHVFSKGPTDTGI